MQNKIFYLTCFGFLGGVLFRSFVSVNSYHVILFAVMSFAVLLFFTLVSQNRVDLPAGRQGTVFSVFILALCLGILRFSAVDVPNPVVFESQVGKKVSLIGKLVDEPSLKENNQQLIAETIQGEDRTRVLISAFLDEYYTYGDEIRFTGTLKKPENFMTDQGKVFDYINYLRKDGILYMMSYPAIEIVSGGNGNPTKNFLFLVKREFLEAINFAVPAPENLLLGGLILGEKASFSEDLRQSFVDTGTIHIVALSGYNVTIVAEWFMKILSFLPFIWSIGAGIFVIILFILMTGASSTAVRAGIMSVIALIARATGRNYDVARALILAAVSMVLLNPFILAFDVSFQLSFIATVAVIFLAPKMEKYFYWVTKNFGLRDIVSVTTAAYIFVLPFILYKMGNLSLVALPANILVLPFIPLTMGLGFLTGVLGFIFPLLSVPFGYISYLFLHYELSVIKFLAGVPFAAFSFPNFPFFLTLIIYAYFMYKLFGQSIKNFFIW